jgi:hypothetical protein
MTRVLDKATIETAFDEIGRRAVSEGVVLDMAVCGGSCLILASNIRLASEDVDAVYLNNADIARSIVRKVTIANQLGEDWLNQAAKQFLFPRFNPEPNLIEFNNYPRNEAIKGLRIFTPTPEYMLAMKILANRSSDDLSKNLTDTTDAVALMRLTKIDTYEKIVDLMQQCYPNVPGIVIPTVSSRIDTKIKNLMRAYDERQDNDPEWNAGRGSLLSPQK